jgi:hypothetical protein
MRGVQTEMREKGGTTIRRRPVEVAAAEAYEREGRAGRGVRRRNENG